MENQSKKIEAVGATGTAGVIHRKKGNTAASIAEHTKAAPVPPPVSDTTASDANQEDGKVEIDADAAMKMLSSALGGEKSLEELAKIREQMNQQLSLLNIVLPKGKGKKPRPAFVDALKAHVQTKNRSGVIYDSGTPAADSLEYGFNADLKLPPDSPEAIVYNYHSKLDNGLQVIGLVFPPVERWNATDVCAAAVTDYLQKVGVKTSPAHDGPGVYARPVYSGTDFIRGQGTLVLVELNVVG